MARERVERADGDVPLLLRPTKFLRETAALGAVRRRHVIESSAHEERCPEAQAYLEAILGRLVRGSKLDGFARAAPKITLILQCARQRGLPVAKAGPGNILLVPGALLARAASEDAVAAVLAHELAHLSLRHAERFAEAASFTHRPDPRSLKSEHEREADITGLSILVRAGYDPRAAVDHLRAVDEQARGPQPEARARSPRRGPVHDSAELRVLRLEGQIQACRYVPVERRVEIVPAVRQEAERIAARAELRTQTAANQRD